ncbi:MAG: hypothetical protein LR008_03405 [Candidatus Pacebacteria bacterium]|nr:hypothetical protein [Candidatus Paceibacterota bacterium]
MNINYDDFAKLEIKIGTIVSAEVVPDADRLLKLMVDFSEAEPRQIVSGIREFFDDIDILVGKQSPFVTNMEPRTIRGLESQGMILAASTDELFSILSPNQELPSGTLVQ